MTTPHKWADVIKAWADGKTIQFANKYTDGWVDFEARRPYVQSYFTKNLWRVKPNTIKYRRYIYAEPNGNIYSVENYMQLNDQEEPSPSFELSEGFVRWIDTEWQEEEV